MERSDNHHHPIVIRFTLSTEDKMKKAVTIIIGNSDNKLSQLEWSIFVDKVEAAIADFHGVPQFSGGSGCAKPWQNFCWVFLLEDDVLIFDSFKRQLCDIRTKYQQDSIAWIDGETLFL